MNKIVRMLILLAMTPLFSLPSQAQNPIKRVVRFVQHHEILVADTVVVLAFSAEAASAVHCHSTDPECYYTPNETGTHYTTAKIVGYDALLSAGVIGAQELVWRWGKKQELESNNLDAKHLIWGVVAPVAAVEASFAVRNTNPLDTNLEAFAPKGPKWPKGGGK